MEEELMERMSEYKDELFFRYKEKEKEFGERVKEAEIFGMMKKSVDIAQKLIETGVVEDDLISQTTGLSLQHILCLRH